MFFTHENSLKKDGCFYIGKNETAKAPSFFNKAVLKEFWKGHTFFYSDLEFEKSENLTFTLGEFSEIELENYAYVINIEKSGVYISAKDEKSLIHGFMTFLDCIETDENKNVFLPCCEIKESPFIEKRMLHFCIFPETRLWEFEKIVRLCGALKFTHIIVEFWGMLKYDCQKELSWDFAFSKEEIKPIISMANDLGIEIIPMFNHWGHASQSRQIHGKHVVLDQNPSLAYLFNDSGWNWNVKSNEVRQLLKKVRNELTELCGKGEYFHIGCDEADGFGYSKEETDIITDFINETSHDLALLGRKTIMWADMLLCKKSYSDKNIYVAQAPDEKNVEYMLNSLDKSIILADWQYDTKKAPVETAISLKNHGFCTFLCPWDRSFENIKACTDTVKKYNLGGIIHTTWHTLSNGIPHVAQTARLCQSNSDTAPWHSISAKVASVMRKTYFAHGDYEKSGWAKCQIGTITE